MPHWPYRLAMSVIVVGALALGAIFGYVFWPVPIVYIDQPMPVVNRQVQHGDWLEVKVHYVKPYAHESLVGFMFASKGRVAFGPVGLSALPVGTHVISVYVQVPTALPPGDYIVILIVERSVRLPLPTLFDRPVTAASESFTVTE